MINNTIDKYIESALRKSFKEYKEVRFNDVSKDVISKFIRNEFIKNLDKKINLEKACKTSHSKESELIGDIQQLLITSKINGCEKTLENIKDLIGKHRGD